jgi:Escherichia/Staphylococcus phage prohead protease
MTNTIQQRAYSTITIKTIQEDLRIIEGIASTPAPDRVDDVVEPLGAKFNLPMPLLWQHNSREPIGHVMWAEARSDGIPFKAVLAKSLEPGKLQDRLDEAWQSIKLGLVRAVSIGFRAIEAEPIDAKQPWAAQRYKK